MGNFQSQKQLVLNYYNELDQATKDEHFEIFTKYTSRN